MLFMLASDIYYQKTERHYFMNITHLDNLPSIKEHGILCYELAHKYMPRSIALEDVQQKRDAKQVPYGLQLHKYACLYFDARNPMMYHLISHPEKVDIQELCVLKVSSKVLELQGTVITDGNAASNITRFFPPNEGIDILSFNNIFAKYWNDDDLYVKAEKARQRCAEILVPYCIPFDCVIGVFVPSAETERLIAEMNIDKDIEINKELFFL